MQAEMTDAKEYTPETLRSASKIVEDIRVSLLFNIEDAGADPESEQYFLLALSSLDSATRFLTLAAMKQSQGLAR